jgi:hypothetical protein
MRLDSPPRTLVFKMMMNKYPLLSLLVVALLPACTNVSAPEAQGALGTILGKPSTDSSASKTDVRHMPPPPPSGGQLGWQMKF